VQYWEKAEFPFQIIPKLGALRVAGGTIKVICYIFSYLAEVVVDAYEMFIIFGD